ncbi:MAG: DUF3500 domain-containing protein [Pseudomonadota bacterium]
MTMHVQPQAIFAALIAISLAAVPVPALSHQAPIHEHTQLVPIPDYKLPHGPAGGAAALQAANAFLASFDETSKAQFIFDLDAEERSDWSNLPAGIVNRVGISVGELTDKQRKLLFEFLASSLSEEGYRRVMDVMAAEAFLSTDKRAKRLKWNPENYWLSFYGMPSADTPWGWQFGGHHLGLNLSIDGGKVETMSPSFVGTEPAVFTLNAIDYEAVVDMHHAGHAVFASLDAKQKASADAGSVPDDIRTGPGKDGVVTPVIGLNTTGMSDEQKNLLLKAIAMWVTIQPDENSVLRMAEIEAELDQISFAWTGGNDVNSPVYMRIQGPTLIIELLSTGGNVGQSASGLGHYHTIYRNPTREYGM